MRAPTLPLAARAAVRSFQRSVATPGGRVLLRSSALRALACTVLLLLLGAGPASAQERRERSTNELLRRLVLGARRCDIVHYDLHVSVPASADPAAEIDGLAAEIRAKIRVQGVLKEPVRALQFLILNVAQVGAARVAGADVPFTLRPSLPDFPISFLEIVLPAPLARGEGAEVEIDYRMPSTHAGADGRPTRRPTDPWFGPEELHTNLASAWYPGNLYEQHTVDLTVTVPAGVRVVASGVPGPETEEPDGRTTFRFREDSGMNVITVVAGRYQVHTVQRDGRELALYARTLPHPLDVGKILDDLAFCLEFFERKFGPSGLTRFAVVVSPPSYATASYNAKHYALVQAPLFQFHDLAPDAGGAVWFGVLAHEAAHVWWGHKVRSDLLGNGGNWLREGLAEFSSWQALEARYGDRLPPLHCHRRMLREYLESVRLLGAAEPSLVDVTYAMPLDTTYEKGAWLFAMLERMVGAEAFERTLARYAAAAATRTATWKTFHKAAAEESTVDLGEFFARWLVGTDHLDLAAGVREEGGGRWQVTVGQTGEFPAESSPAFRVTAETAGGAMREWTVRLPGAGKSLELPVDARPRSVRVDPECRLLDCERGNNRWPATWETGVRASWVPPAQMSRALETPWETGALYVHRVAPGSPAARARLEGALVTSLAGRPVRSPDAFEWACWDLGRDEPLELIVRSPEGTCRVVLWAAEPVEL